jgi:hypothetical protein
VAPASLPSPVVAPAHTIVVETPRDAAADALAEQVARLGACTVRPTRGGGSRIALGYCEPHRANRMSSLSRILTTVERWLRRQPVADVTVWVDGRRFTLTRRDATTGPRAPSPHARGDHVVARTASS